MLLKIIEEFKEIIPNLDASIQDLDDFDPYINTAEDWLKRDILGKALYDHLNSDSGMQTGEIYNRCREVIALHAYLNAMPDFDVIQTSTGLGVINNKDFAPASKDRAAKLAENINKRLDLAIEDLIDFLIGSPSEYFDKWKESSAHNKIYETLVYSARDFSEYYDIQDNRTLYISIKNDLKAVEQTKISEKISTAFLNELKTKQKEYKLTEKINAIFPSLKYAIIYYAMSSAMSTERITVFGNTVKLSGPNNAFTRMENRKLQEDFNKLGNEFLQKVVNHLKKNADDYPTYKESDEYARETYSGWANDDQTDPIFVGPS